MFHQRLNNVDFAESKLDELDTLRSLKPNDARFVATVAEVLTISLENKILQLLYCLPTSGEFVSTFGQPFPLRRRLNLGRNTLSLLLCFAEAIPYLQYAVCQGGDCELLSAMGAAECLVKREGGSQEELAAQLAEENFHPCVLALDRTSLCSTGTRGGRLKRLERAGRKPVWRLLKRGKSMNIVTAAVVRARGKDSSLEKARVC